MTFHMQGFGECRQEESTSALSRDSIDEESQSVGDKQNHETRRAAMRGSQFRSSSAFANPVRTKKADGADQRRILTHADRILW
jgi:hypothetical protein